MQYLERPTLLRLLPTPNITGFPAEIKIVKKLFPISIPCTIQKTHIKPRGDVVLAILVEQSVVYIIQVK